MLPPEAKVYFDNLWAEASSNAWRDISQDQEQFQRQEFSSGQRAGDGSYAARLVVVYRDNLSARATSIADALKSVHHSFGSPLDKDVDAQLGDWGVRALSETYRQLEAAYARHLQRFGVQLAHAAGLDLTYTLAQAAVADSLARYLWALRHVPAKHPTATQQERQIMQQNTYNISDVNGSQIQINSDGSTQAQTNHLINDVETVKGLIEDLSGVLDRVSVSGPAEAELRAELATLRAQANSPKPKWEIIRSTARSIKAIAEGAAGNILGALTQPQIATLLALAAS